MDKVIEDLSLVFVFRVFFIDDLMVDLLRRLNTDGEAPSPRACHAATTVGTLLLIQVIEMIY